MAKRIVLGHFEDPRRTKGYASIRPVYLEGLKIDSLKNRRLATVAVIIPSLNEEQSLQRALDLAMANADEVIISDGGSTDSTLEIASSFGAKIVTGEPGRGPQLNRGAEVATSDIYLFLHADTTLPDNGLDQIRAAADAGAVGGGFSVNFDADTFWFRLGNRIVNARTRLTGLPLGDQGQFVTAKTFESMGGYRPWPILEDLDFARRLKQQGKVATLDSAVTTSARRYLARGTTRTIATNWLIWALYLVGISPHRLAKLYRHVR